MPKILCIGGKAQNGKDTSAVILQEELRNRGNEVKIIHYADLLKFICKNYFDWDGNKDSQGRTLLQQVGTETVRKQAPDYWVDFVISLVNLFSTKWDYVIIPDTRFPNELYKWKQAGYDVTYIKVERKNFTSPLTKEQQTHLSEIALDEENPDLILINDGSIEDLKNNIKQLCQYL